MKKRILVITKNGFKLHGNYYESDNSNVCNSDGRTEQDCAEFLKVMNRYRVNDYQLACWKVES